MSELAGGKSPLKSLGIMGPVIAIVSWVIRNWVGIELTDAEIEKTVEVGMQVVEVAGMLAGAYGRWRAKERIEVRRSARAGGGTARSPAWVVVLAAVLLVGCADSNPIDEAARVSDVDREQRDSYQQIFVTAEREAAALYGIYVISLEAAAEIIRMDETPDQLVFAIDDAAQEAEPYAERLYRTVQAYRELRGDVAQIDQLSEDDPKLTNLQAAVVDMRVATEDAREPITDLDKLTD